MAGILDEAGGMPRDAETHAAAGSFTPEDSVFSGLRSVASGPNASVPSSSADPVP